MFDPFVGSGTVLLEAARLSLTAYGTEVNPAAFVLARAYHFVNVPHEERQRLVNRVLALLETAFPYRLLQPPLSPDEVRKSLLKTATNSTLTGYEIILLELLITLMDFQEADLSEAKVFRVWQKIANHILQLPFSSRPIQAFLSDARATSLEVEQIDFVITSPPYINVFNYHQQYRISLEALGWNLLEVAKSEIGSNRKHRGNRFLTVIQYCLDMALVFIELQRVCHPDAQLIFVVGRESNVRGVPFYNGAIVAEVAYQAASFHLKMRQERYFQNRFGQQIYEDILHLSMPSKTLNPFAQDHAQKVALKILEGSYEIAHPKTRADIQMAIDQLDTVYPSPILNLKQPIV